MKILFFDTETTGKPIDYKAPVSNVDNWPRLVQLAFILCDDQEPDPQDEIGGWCVIVKPENFIIPDDVIEIHGITNEIARRDGLNINTVLDGFKEALKQADMIVGHNISFDRKVMGAELIRGGHADILHGKPRICTMMKSTRYCQLPGKYGYKWPQLKELYFKLFEVEFEGAHDALEDIRAAKRCYFELRRLGVITDRDIDNTFNRTEIQSF